MCLICAFKYGAQFIPLFTNQYFYEKIYIYKRSVCFFGVLMPLSAIFQLYHGDQF